MLQYDCIQQICQFKTLKAVLILETIESLQTKFTYLAFNAEADPSLVQPAGSDPIECTLSLKSNDTSLSGTLTKLVSTTDAKVRNPCYNQAVTS